MQVNMEDYFDEYGIEIDNAGYEPCLLCGGPAFPMGTLGNKAWHRCQDCGIEFSVNR